ncbi:MAG: hypothetical protein WCP96_11555 [Methylococcaceae bacterium]
MKTDRLETEELLDREVLISQHVLLLCCTHRVNFRLIDFPAGDKALPDMGDNFLRFFLCLYL